MGDLSPHFSRREFRCKHCGRRVGPPVELLNVLERIRAITGKPLRIVSGYRCPEYNRQVGGAEKSRHMSGDAADIPPGHATTQQARAAGARGIGSSGRWATHIDMRPRPAQWRYD